MPLRLLAVLLLLATALHAQQPNSAYRLPVTPDMPEWAKQLYRTDIQVNAFEIHEAFEAWEAAEGLDEAVADDPDAEAGFEENRWEEYYQHWRRAVEPYIQPDGSLDFRPLQPPAQTGQHPDGAGAWSLKGPLVTYWTRNDNLARPVAPWQANVYAIDVAPSDPNILYYGTETGALGKTTDKGLHWSPIGLDNPAFRSGVGAVAIHPTDPNTLYVGNASGIYKSADGGATWTQDLNAANFNTNDIKIKPDAPETVLAAGSSLRRRAAGPTWSTLINRTTYDLDFKPGAPDVAYALVQNAAGDLCEFYKSTDGGATFSPRSTGWIGALGDGGGRLTVTPADPNRIYVVLLTSSGPRVLRSVDAGETWTVTVSGGTAALGMDNGQGFYDLSISASHTFANQLIVGTTTAYKSTDNGATYTVLGGYSGPFGIHPDIQEMKTMGGDSWIVTDGGINLSTDFWTATGNFSTRTNGLAGSHFWGFDQGWNEDVLVGGRYHNGNTAWHENYPAGSFLRMGGGEAATGYVNPGNNRMVYFSDIGGRLLPAAINQNYSSFTVNQWPNESYFSMEWSEMEWDPRFFYTYYMGSYNGLLKTTDNGANFSAVFAHADAAAKVQHIEVSRVDPRIIYCTVQRYTIGELWKTTDGGAHWTTCANPVGPTPGQRRISNVALSGTDPNTLWWCFRTGPNGNKIFKSVDGGATWTNLTTPALNGISLSDMAHQLGTDGGIYLIGDFGAVFYRNNKMSDWVAYDTGLPQHLNTEISRIRIFYKNKKLRLASVNGIWETDLYENSTTTLVQPMVDNSAPGCGRDTLQLESYSVVNGPASYHWTITPAPQWISDADSRNPRVVLGPQPGYYAASLTITDDNGTTSRGVDSLIYNLPDGDLCGPDAFPGKSLLLDGSGDYAVPNNSLNLNSNTVTMSAWVKRNGILVDFAGILYARGGTTSAGLSIASDYQLRYTWDEAAGSYNFNTGFILPNNVWTHVALVVTPDSATVYMNGVGATRKAAHAAEAFDTPLKIGFDQGNRYFKGEIDEVTVWNRSLSRDEIRELMHLTLTPADQPNLVSYYQFNEPSGAAIDKAASRSAVLLGTAGRTGSTGPFGGGTSARKTVNFGGAVDFPGTGVVLGFPTTGGYPKGDIVVSRIDGPPDSLPGCSAYASDQHYWIIDNYGTNAAFSVLDSARFGNITVPATGALSPNSYQLQRRTANAHLLPWILLPGSSTGATGGAGGHVRFGKASGISQFGQFVVTNTLPGSIIQGPGVVCSGQDAGLDAGPGYTAYAWSNGGGAGQSANFAHLTANTTYTVTVTTVDGCTGSAMQTVSVNPLPVVSCPADGQICLDAAPLVLTGGSPAGGIYEGPAVNAGVFTHPVVGPYPLTYMYTDANGCSDTCAYFIQVDSCLVARNFSGSIRWAQDGTSGVNLASVQLAGDQSAAATTNTLGDYALTAFSGANFTLTPTKIANPLNGVTVADATAIQQFLAGTRPLSTPYQRIAADADRDDAIAKPDADLLVQALLSNPAALNQLHSWRFVPAAYTFPDPVAPWGFPEKITLNGVSSDVPGQDFLGIKTGDLVAGFADPANFGPGDSLVWVVPEQTLAANTEVLADFSVHQLADLASFQMALGFNPAQLQFLDATPLGGLPMGPGDFGTYNSANGEVRVVWSQPQGVPLAEGTPVFRLRFLALQGGIPLSSALDLDETALPAYAYTSALNQLGVGLEFAQASKVTQAGPRPVVLLENRPNPFKGTTTVGFVLPEACEAQLRVLDVRGREIWRMRGAYPAGYSEATIRLGDSAAAGMLFCELVTPFGVLTRKMVLVR